MFAETFTNPLVRAQDVAALVALVRAARATAPELRLVLDSTIATPWAFATPLLAQGVDVVLASGTKALGGSDRDLWGYIATNDTPFGERRDGSARDARRHPRLAARPRRSWPAGTAPRPRTRAARPPPAVSPPSWPAIRGSSGCSIRPCPSTPTPP